MYEKASFAESDFRNQYKRDGEGLAKSTLYLSVIKGFFCGKWPTASVWMRCRKAHKLHTWGVLNYRALLQKLTHGISINGMPKGIRDVWDYRALLKQSDLRHQYKWDPEGLTQSTLHTSDVSIHLACQTPVAKSRSSHLDFVDFCRVTCDLQGPCREVYGVVPRKVWLSETLRTI